MTLNKNQLENRKQWVRDLLSGDFKQAVNAFKQVRDGVISYCCLGVACQRVVPDSPELRIASGNVVSDGVMMSDAVAAHEFHMTATDQSQAASWNDTKGYSFSRIADFVAYATESGQSFADIAVDDIPEGYAPMWLKLSELN